MELDTKHVSDFHIALQAVSYAVSGSRLVVDMIGHAGPGGSYTLLKEWLLQLSSSPLQVPSGMLVVAFDNEQRLLKNYLSHGANRSRIDVLTNIICAVFDGKNLEQQSELHPSNWKRPTAEKLADACCVEDVMVEEEFKSLLFPYIEDQIRALVAAGSDDGVKHLQQEIEKERKFIKCPNCNALIEKRKRNCTNCDVGNVRKAIAQAEGSTRVSTEHVRSKKPTHSLKLSRYEPCTHVTGGVEQVVLKSTKLNRPSTERVKPAKISLVEPLFVNPNSHDAVRALFDHLGRVCGVNGDGERDWLVVECDGLPYLLAKTVIHRSQIEAQKQTLKEAGSPATSSLKGPELKQELRRRE